MISFWSHDVELENGNAVVRARFVYDLDGIKCIFSCFNCIASHRRNILRINANYNLPNIFDRDEELADERPIK